MASTASRNRLWKKPKVVPPARAVPVRQRRSTPATPARNDEMQKTMTRVMFTSAPWVTNPTGESARPRRSRPNRLRPTTTARATLTTAIPAHR
jgi:hypothetical protein